MKKEEDSLAIALTKEACFLCGHQQDGDLILNTRLTPGEARKVKELDGKCIGYMREPCSECKEMMKQGILLIGFIEKKTTDNKNPYRSGNKWVVTEDYIKRLFSPDPELMERVLTKRYSFIAVELAEQLNFPDCNINA